MTVYLLWTGIIANLIIFAALGMVLWVWFIWPAVEAFSKLRWYKACEKAYPTEIKLKPWYKIFAAEYEIFGRQYESVSHRFGKWRGIGKWQVY